MSSIVEMSVRSATGGAYEVVDNAAFAVRHADSPTLSGQSLGFALKWAHWLVDEGARPDEVRKLLEIGLRAGTVKEPMP